MDRLTRQVLALSFYLAAIVLFLLSWLYPFVGPAVLVLVVAVLTPDILNWIDRGA